MDIRQRILDAGVTLLHEHGMAALTQPRIARTAGVSQSHLTYYFPTRNVLILAIAEHSVEQALAQPQPQSEPGGADPAQMLAATIRFLPRVRMLLGLVAAADQDPELRDALSQLITHVRGMAMQMLTRLGYRVGPEQIVLFHAAVVGLGALHLGRQNLQSDQEIETGLHQLLALLPTASSEAKDPS